MTPLKPLAQAPSLPIESPVILIHGGDFVGGSSFNDYGLFF